MFMLNPIMFIIPVIFMIIFCGIFFFVFRKGFPFFNRGENRKCWPFFWQNDSKAEINESKMAEELEKLRKENKELKDILDKVVNS